MLLVNVAHLVTALATIHGTVRAADHGLPLAGVTIIVDGTLHTRTDSVGGYTVDSLAPGNHDFRFSSVGYDTRRVTILLADRSDLTLDIELVPHPITLPPIEVIATTRPIMAPIEPSHGDGWRGAGRYRFDTDWQLRHPATALDLNQAIATVPGVTTRSDNALAVSIHGGRGSENLVLLDGIPLLGAVHFAGASSAIAPEAIAGFDVRTGIAPARFGDALAGVIDLRSADALPPVLAISAVVSTTDLRTTVRAPVGNTGGIMLAGRSSFRNLLSDESGLGLDNGYQDAVLTGHLGIGRGVLRVVAFGNTNRVTWRTTAPASDSGSASDETTTLTDRANWRSAALGLTWRLPTGPGRRWQTSAWWNGTDAGITMAGTARLDSRLSQFGIRSDLDRPLGHGALRFGGELRHPGSRYALDTDGGLALRNAPTLGALYGEWALSTDTPWSLHAGLRMESDFHTLLALDPRLVIDRRIGRGTLLTAGFGRTHQAVQSLLNEDNVGSAVIGPSLPIASGPGQPIADATQWTAGLTQRIGATVLVTLEGYRRDWHHVLTPAVTSGGLFAVAPDVGDGHAEGVLASLSGGAGPVTIRASVGLGRAIQQSGGVSYPTGAARPWSFDGDIGVRPTEHTDLQLRWTTGAGQDRSAIAPGIEWQPYQPGTGSGEFEGTPTNLPGAINALRLASPLRIDFGIRHRWSLGAGSDRHPALTTTIRIHNLLDRTNPIGVMARPDGSYQWLRGTPRGLIAEVGWRF